MLAKFQKKMTLIEYVNEQEPTPVKITEGFLSDRSFFWSAVFLYESLGAFMFVYGFSFWYKKSQQPNEEFQAVQLEIALLTRDQLKAEMEQKKKDSNESSSA